MKIQLASDLHLEHVERLHPTLRLIEPAADADVLVLAGDIHRDSRTLEVFADWPVPVLYVAGNHEFYGADWRQQRAILKTACAATNVVFLDNDVVRIGGVRFLGCTLWTDFLLPGRSQTRWMSEVELGLNDYFVIRTLAGPLRARDTLADHQRSRAWLEEKLEERHSGRLWSSPITGLTH